MKNFITIITLVCALHCNIYAQKIYNNSIGSAVNGYFNHLDIAITGGTTGIGIEVASPIGEYVQVRTGFEYMPHFNINMDFGIQVAKEGETSVNATESRSRFEKLSGVLTEMTGYQIDDKVTMRGEPRLHNFKLLFDVFPFQNKKWHFTAGFYAGPSRIGIAENITEDMTTLMAVGIYNNMYEKAKIGEPIFAGISLPPFYERKIVDDWGKMSMHVGNYKTSGVTSSGETYNAGDPYRMTPNENSMVTVKVKTNRFRPYLGFGYGNSIVPKSKYSYSFDCGLMFWGGTPKILTHDGTDLARDVENIGGKVEDCVKFIKAIKAYPVINFRVSRRIF